MLTLLAVVLIALTTSAWLAFKTAEEESLKVINQRGDDISRFVATSLSFSVVGYDYHTIQLLLDEIVSFEDINYAEVVNTRGNTMGTAGAKKNLADQTVLRHDIKLSENIIGHLELGLSTANTISGLKKQKYLLLKREALLILLIAIGEFIALSLIIIRPVRLISKTLDSAVDGNGRVVKQIEINTSDEFGQLAFVFNRLGKQLNSANDILQSKVELADEELIDINKKLLKQANELKIVRDDFHKMSITDVLTQLFNRRYFEGLLEEEVKIMKRYGDVNSIFLIDIDYFKKINDQYGHPKGDQVLKDFAQLILSNVRVGDVTCRIGGEEFVVFCRRINKDDAIELAEKMRDSISRSVISVGGNKIKVTVSIGVSTYRHDLSDQETMLLYEQADVALYKSKNTGRNKVTHYENI